MWETISAATLRRARYVVVGGGLGEKTFRVVARPKTGRFGRNDLHRKALAEPHPMVECALVIELVCAVCAMKTFPTDFLRTVQKTFRKKK